MRYVLLVILNTPIILLGLLNIVTQYKMKRVSKQRFRHQVILWILILVVIVSSFPLYNYLIGKPLLGSSELSLLDIIQTTTIIAMLYALNSQRQKIDQAEKIIRDLHQEVSIRLSGNKNE